MLKTPYRNGTTHVIFEPLDLMAHIPVRHPSGDLRSFKSAILPIGHRAAGLPVRCTQTGRTGAAAAPESRIKTGTGLTRFHGVFAPNSPYRARITPACRGRGARPAKPARAKDRTPAEQQAAMRWAQRLKRVFRIDVETCPSCGGTVEVIASIEDPPVIERVDSWTPTFWLRHMMGVQAFTHGCPGFHSRLSRE